MSEHAEPETEPVGDDGPMEGGTTPGADPIEARPLGPGEGALLDAFERRSPQGGLRWGFDDAMRRIEHPDIDSTTGAGPWKGLPDDLWERGRSARIGQRFVGDVAGVLAEILAADARVVAGAAAAGVNVAVWDALRYLSARVEVLEARVDPLGLEAAEWPGPVPDPGEWVDAVDGWLGPPQAEAPVVVGESGAGALLAALRQRGRRVLGIEPRGAAAWRSMSDDRPEGAAEVVLSEVVSQLVAMPDASAAAVVLLGCVDRLDLDGQLALLGQSVRVLKPGGTVVVLVADQTAWSAGLSPPARDLAPGRPLHPETWTFLFRRSGAATVAWHRPSSGSLHAVVARFEP